jgi:putative spermidine/putrescine transport system substrate-binding protein
MTKPEIDFLIDYLIPLKKAGHFRAFWENFGQSINLMVNGEVALESMWSPAPPAIEQTIGAGTTSRPLPDSSATRFKG